MRECLRQPFISALLDSWGGRTHDARYGFGHLLPLGFFDHELFLAFWGEPVVLEFPIAIRVWSWKTLYPRFEIDGRHSTIGSQVGAVGDGFETGLSGC